MRIILKCDRDTSRLWMLNELKWMSIAQKIKLNVIIMIFKIKNQKAPEYLNDFITETKHIHNRNTRNMNDYLTIKVKVEEEVFSMRE